MQSSGGVALYERDPAWRDLYEGEGIRLLEALGESVRDIEHVGSTAIQGVPARPIVDIMVGVDSLEAATQHVVALQELGYEYFGEAGLERRRFFRKREPNAFHLELLLYQGAHWRRRLALREYLRDHADEAESFGEAKRALLSDDDVSVEAYNERKRPLLEEWSGRAVEAREHESEP